MSQRMLHQFLTGATHGDAITGQAFLMRDWLRDLGFNSDIFAQYVHESVADEVKSLSAYRRTSGETWTIYRHSIGSAVPDFLSQQKLTLFLIYHNITPPKYFTRVDPMWADKARQGLAQLHDLRQQTGLAAADSAFNELDLTAAGFQATSVLPITLHLDRYQQPNNEITEARIQQAGPNLLFVGRFAPNKKQEDLVRLMVHLHRIYPSAKLYMVGARWEVGYDTRVEQMAAEFGLSENVLLTGKVSHQDLLTYYRTCDLYVSMSEHEGFGVPLIESMYCGLPVLAYGVAAVPFTMDTTGVIFTEKRYPELAELVDILLTDEALRRRLIAHQSEYVQTFLEPHTRQLFEGLLSKIELLN